MVRRVRPLISIIILDFNGQEFWSGLIGALRSQRFRDFEVIVVENGGMVSLPTDCSREILLSKLRSETNLGFAGGVNAGAKIARGAYLAFLNNDAIPEPHWLERLFEVLAEDEAIGAVCSKVLFDRKYCHCEISMPVFVPCEVDPKLTDERELGIRIDLTGSGIARHVSSGVHGLERGDGEEWVWTKAKVGLVLPVGNDGKVRLRFDSHPVQAGKTLKIKWESGATDVVELEGNGVRELVFESDLTGETYLVNNAGSEIREGWHVEERGLYEPDDGSFDEPLELEAASACSMIVRREALEGEMPFDPEFFAYYEDVDLSRKLRKRGWKILYEPKSVVYHKRSGTAGTQSAFQVFHATRNRFWVIAKHAPLRVVWNAVSREMWDLSSYKRYLNEDFSLSRLYRETWLGFVKRFLVRILDLE